MASTERIQLCKVTDEKLPGNVPGSDFNCDPILLPSNAYDTVAIAKCMVINQQDQNGDLITDLKMRLEHSPDNVNWTPVQYKHIEASGAGSATSWGNEWFLDNSQKSSEAKNKHAQLFKNFSAAPGNTSQDDCFSVTANIATPFNLSYWLKIDPTNENVNHLTPQTLSAQIVGNKKYFLPPTDNTNAWGTYGLNDQPFLGTGSAATGPWGTLNSQGTPNYGDVWGVSFWVKHAATNAVSGQDTMVFYTKGSSSSANNLAFYAGYRLDNNSTGASYYFVKYYTPSGSLKEFRSATTNITLGSWFHVTISKTTTTSSGNSYAASDIDFYINGVQLTTSIIPGSGSWEDHTWGDNTWVNVRAIQLFNQGSDTSKVMPSVDEFSFWNKDISGDASSLYNSGVPTDLAGSTGLYGYYRLGDGDATGDGTGTDDTYQLLHDMSGTNGTDFNVQYIGNTFNGTLTSVVADHPSGDMQTEDVAATIDYSPILFRSGGKIADPFNNRQSLKLIPISPETAKTKFLQVASNTEIDGAITAATKSFTYNTWLKTDVAPSTSTTHRTWLENTKYYIHPCDANDRSFIDGNNAKGPFSGATSGNMATYGVPTELDAYSVNHWVKFKLGMPSYKSIVFWGGPYTYQWTSRVQQLHTYKTGNQNWLVATYLNSGRMIWDCKPGDLRDDKWHMLTITKKAVSHGDTATIDDVLYYLDGIEVTNAKSFTQQLGDTTSIGYCNENRADHIMASLKGQYCNVGWCDEHIAQHSTAAKCLAQTSSNHSDNVGAGHWTDGPSAHSDGVTGHWTPRKYSNIYGAQPTLSSGKQFVVAGEFNTAVTAGDVTYDEMSFWQKTLSLSEIQALFNGTPGQAESGTPLHATGMTDLVGYYKFGDGDSVGDGTGTADDVVNFATPKLHDMSGTAGGVDLLAHSIAYGGSGDGALGIHPSSGTGSHMQVEDVVYETTDAPVLFRNGGKYDSYAASASLYTAYAGSSHYQARDDYRCTKDNLTGVTNLNMKFNSATGHTIGYWYKRTPANTASIAWTDAELWCWDSNALERYFHFMPGGTTLYRLYWKNASTWEFSVNWDYSTTTLYDGNWHYIQMVYKGGVIFDSNTTGTNAFELYIDNNLIAQDSVVWTTGDDTTPSGVNDTGQATGAGEILQLFRGQAVTKNQSYISDCTVWNKALNTDERLELYNGAKSVDVTSLSFFSESDCGLWLKMGDASDANALTIDSTTNPQPANLGAGIRLPYAQGTNSMDDYSGNDNHFQPYIYAERSAGGLGTIGTLSTSEYPAGSAETRMGDGLTISLTDKYNGSAVYNSDGSEDSKLIISLDGYESQAKHNLVYDSDLADGTWKNLQVTYDHTASSAARISTFLNGVEINPIVAPSITWTDSYLKNVGDTAINAVIGGTGFLEATTDVHNLQGEILDTSFHSEAIDVTDAVAIYNSGKPVDLDVVSSLTTSAIKHWWKFEETAANTAPVDRKTNSNLVLNNFNTVVDSTIPLLSSDTEYFEELLFGQGMTISLTDKIDSSGVWSYEGNEDPHILVSFNGFENDAEQWVSWKCEQLDINKEVTDDPETFTAFNLLDGEWHNIVFSYRGGITAGTVVNFGLNVPGDTGNHHFHMALDSYRTQHLPVSGSPPTTHGNKGFDAAKVVDASGNAHVGGAGGIQEYHINNVTDTYVPTVLLASGIYSYNQDPNDVNYLTNLNQDTQYSYQGSIDEFSYHSQTFWSDSALPNQLCDCPLEALWGNNDERQNASQAGWANRPLTPGVPHDLLDPGSINTHPTDVKAYLDPIPAGEYGCDEGKNGHHTQLECEAADNHSTTPQDAHWVQNTDADWRKRGGLEIWWRFGDTPTDCKSCIWDAREHFIDAAATRRSGAVGGSLSQTDLVAASTLPESIYVQAGGATAASTVSYRDVELNCVATGDFVFRHLNVPHLHFMRAVYTGVNGCPIVNGKSSCVAAIHYRS